MFAIDTTGMTVLALLCVFIHECGHIFTLIIFKIPIERISMKLFGINIEIRKDYVLSYKKEAVIALAGCFANFLTAAAAFILADFNFSPKTCNIIALQSVIIGTLNILPIGSLDGARALESLILQKLSIEKAQTAVNITSVVFILPLIIFGAYVFFVSKFNISLAAVAVYLLLFLIKKNGAVTANKRAKSSFH
jgi:stage IV sporulation protein FB